MNEHEELLEDLKSEYKAFKATYQDNSRIAKLLKRSIKAVEALIADEEYLKAFTRAHKDYPHSNYNYSTTPSECNHEYNFCVFCNSVFDIMRCLKCGNEVITSCHFDDDYD